MNGEPTSMSELLQRRWKEGKLPAVEGVVFDSGVVEELDFDSSGWFARGTPPLRRGRRTDLAAWAAQNELWVMVNGWQLDLPAHDLRLDHGEGGNGADGFLAASGLRDGRLRWAAFFTTSNPFEELEMDGDVAVVTSNLDHVWRFPLQHPEQVTVDVSADPGAHFKRTALG
ncbi:MAG TPA: hypothetical protein VF755_04075 [Catenuloplanes sp.]|jgi:hypothetical protein